MSGADESGEDFEVGRTNRAQDRTKLLAQASEDGTFDGGWILGGAILFVDQAMEVEDDFKVIVNQDFHGIVSCAIGAGAGVIGFSRREIILDASDQLEELTSDDHGHAESAGVFGKGEHGVVGQGWSEGVVGRGTIGVLGEGMVGVSGQGTDGVGVEGQGGKLSVGVQGTGGELAPGVQGIGGTGLVDKKPQQGVGVVGIGDGTSFPSFDNHYGTGILGYGVTGVHALGNKGRGGVFESVGMPQVRLIPQETRTLRRFREIGSIVPTVPQLPREGLPGDLMTVLDRLDQCTLWLCVGRDKGGPAKWSQLQLGPIFPGTG
jgi:hypothetical protein